jgi:hypothetical protein
VGAGKPEDAGSLEQSTKPVADVAAIAVVTFESDGHGVFLL